MPLVHEQWQGLELLYVANKLVNGAVIVHGMTLKFYQGVHFIWIAYLPTVPELAGLSCNLTPCPA